MVLVLLFHVSRDSTDFCLEMQRGFVAQQQDQKLGSQFLISNTNSINNVYRQAVGEGTEIMLGTVI